MAKKSDEKKQAEKELKKKKAIEEKEKKEAVKEEEKKGEVKEKAKVEEKKEKGKPEEKRKEGKAEEKKKEGKAEEKKKGEDEKPEKKIIKESVHTINLKRVYNLTRTRRAKNAVKVIKQYVKKHARKPAKISTAVNEKLWEKGIKRPPRKIKVKLQEEESIVTVDLV